MQANSIQESQRFFGPEKVSFPPRNPCHSSSRQSNASDCDVFCVSSCRKKSVPIGVWLATGTFATEKLGDLRLRIFGVVSSWPLICKVASRLAHRTCGNDSRSSCFLAMLCVHSYEDLLGWQILAWILALDRSPKNNQYSAESQANLVQNSVSQWAPNPRPNLHSPVWVGSHRGRPQRGGTNLGVSVPLWPVMRMPG